jgi:hypothetical protein
MCHGKASTPRSTEMARKKNPFLHAKDTHEVDVTIERITTKRNISEKAVRIVLDGMNDVLHHLVNEGRTVQVSGYLTFVRRGKRKGKLKKQDEE